MRPLRLLTALLLTAVLAGCGSTVPADSAQDAPLWSSLTQTGSVELEYAREFTADTYEGGYTLVAIDGREYLLCPQSEAVPEGLPDGITVIETPLRGGYLAATSAMDFFVSLDGLDSLAYSGTDADGWYIAAAREAMEQGELVYAGKYSAPDYEQLVQGGCGLAIESTMILHAPQVQEQLERLGIPVLIERSSYESEPLGRLEWIKLYGLLLDKLPEAQQLYTEKLADAQAVLSQPAAGGTVGYFYITANGAVNVRREQDYIARMIDMAGGEYLAPDSDDGSARSTVTVQMEQFYAMARDADYLIYNSTIDGELHSVQELLDKSSLLGDFAAVQNGQIFCTGKNFFQETMSMTDFLADVHAMLTDPDFSQGTYLYRLKG